MVFKNNETFKGKWKNYFVFSALRKEYDNTLNPKNTKIFFVISLGVMGILAGLRGMIFSAFRQAGYKYDYRDNEYVWNDLVYNPVMAIETGILDITFFLILLLIYQYIYIPIQKNKSPITHDIALLAQMSAIKDILFILYVIPFSFLPLPSSTGYLWNWGWYNKPINLYNLGLYWFFVLFLIVFFLPRIMERLKESYSEYEKRIFVAIVISALIFSLSALLHSIIKVLIDLPLGLV